jgi:hypothetical protein
MTKTIEKLDKLRQYSKAMMNRVLVCLQKQATVNKLLFTEPPSQSEVDHWDHAYYWLKIALFEDFVVSIGALILDHDSRTASYRALYNQVVTDEVRVILDGEYRKVIKEDPVLVGTVSPEVAEFMRKQLEQDRAAKRYAHFQILYERVCREGKLLLEAGTAQKLRSIRDKVIAHLEMTYDEKSSERRLKALGDFPITWGEPFEFFQAAGKQVHDIYLLVNDASYDIEYWDKTCVEGAGLLFNSIHPPKMLGTDEEEIGD